MFLRINPTRPGNQPHPTRYPTCLPKMDDPSTVSYNTDLQVCFFLVDGDGSTPPQGKDLRDWGKLSTKVESFLIRNFEGFFGWNSSRLEESTKNLTKSRKFGGSNHEIWWTRFVHEVFLVVWPPQKRIKIASAVAPRVIKKMQGFLVVPKNKKPGKQPLRRLFPST